MWSTVLVDDRIPCINWQQLLGLFVAAVLLAAGARRVGAPYPVFLAIGGALLAFVPAAPPLRFLPSWRWRCSSPPCSSTPRTMRRSGSPGQLGAGRRPGRLRGRPHHRCRRRRCPRARSRACHGPPAIVLGAIVAPPDAVAATAVLRPLRPPHRILTILEGESLLNDATALLIYRLAVGAVAANGFSSRTVRPDVPARCCRQRWSPARHSDGSCCG